MKIRVAIINDDPEQAGEIASRLRPVNVEVQQLDTLEDAIGSVVADPAGLPDTVLLDWELKWSVGNLASLAAKDVLTLLESYYPAAGRPPRLQGRQAARGGIARLLAEAYRARAVPVMVVSRFLTNMPEKVAEMASAGVSAMFHNNDLADAQGVSRLEQCILSVGGRKRDERMWSGMGADAYRTLFEHILNLTPTELGDVLEEGAATQPLADGDYSEANDLDQMLLSLGRLRVARLACAAQLRDRGRTEDAETQSHCELLASVLDPRVDRIEPPVVPKRATGETLHLCVSGDLSRIDYWVAKVLPGGEAPTVTDYLGSVVNPRLINDLEGVTVFAPSKMAKVRELLRGRRGNRFVHFRNCCIRCGDDIFGPTIDTLLLAQRLVDDAIPAWLRTAPRGEYRIAEMGSGTGFVLATIVASGLCQLKHVHAFEVDAAAASLTCENIQAASPGLGEDRLSATVGLNGLSGYGNASFDIIVSNPPYLYPRAGQEEGRASAEAGHALLEQIIFTDGPRVLSPTGMIGLVISSIARTKVDELCSRAAQAGTRWRINSLGPIRRGIPLDLRKVVDDPQWTEELLRRAPSACELNLAAQDHPFLHQLEVLVLSRDQEGAR